MSESESPTASADSATARLRALVEAQPDDASLWLALGDLERQTGEADAAIEAFQRAAGLYALGGRLIQAIRANKRILELAPDHRDTQGALAELYARGHDPQTAPDAPRSLSQRARQAAEALLGSADDARAKTDAVAHLPEVPLFSQLDGAAFQDVLDGLSLERVAGGTPIIVEGDHSDSFYVLVAGRAKVLKEGPDGAAIHLATLGEGDFFGEFAFLAGTPRSASVVADGDAEVLAFRRDALDQLIRAHPDLGATLQRFYAQRLVETVLKVCPVFQPLADAERDHVAAFFEPRAIDAGEVLIRQGQEGDAFYVIVTGRVGVRVMDMGGSEQALAELGPGDFFGEISLVTGRPTNASCVARSDGLVYQLPREKLWSFLHDYPAVRDVIQEIAHRRVMRTKLASQGVEGMNRGGMV